MVELDEPEDEAIDRSCPCEGWVPSCLLVAGWRRVKWVRVPEAVAAGAADVADVAEVPDVPDVADVPDVPDPAAVRSRRGPAPAAGAVGCLAAAGGRTSVEVDLSVCIGF